MNYINLKSYAKINLALAIKNKREDGYHDIESVMQKISLYDEIKLTKSMYISCNTNRKDIPVDGGNFAFKAASLFFDYLNLNCGVEIYIKKNIPIKAGLGGGSSNAATVLIGLNKLYKTDLTLEILSTLAGRIGADVPFFIYGSTSFVKGIGDVVISLKPFLGYYVLVVKPGFGVSTKEAYSKYDCLRDIEHRNVEDLVFLINSGSSLRDISKYMFNDFEKVFNIDEIKNSMRNLNAVVSLLSGSGSAVFSLFEDINCAKVAKEFFEKKNYSCYICSCI